MAEDTFLLIRLPVPEMTKGINVFFELVACFPLSARSRDRDARMTVERGQRQRDEIYNQAVIKKKKK